MLDINSLSSAQREAVFDDSPALLLKAGAGSGKTTVLIQKILYLVHEKKLPVEKLMVLTFTNKAAGEIKERLKAADPTLEPEKLKLIGTFHSAALFLLQEKLDLSGSGLKKGFTVITPEEEIELALSLIFRCRLNIKYKNRLKKRLEHMDKDKTPDDLQKLARLLSEEKRRLNRAGFKDLIHLCTSLADTTDYRPSYIIIDEVQDCDVSQLEMIDAYMQGNNTKLFAVGDPNQMIYSFRGSLFQIFYTLKKRYQARELSLDTNFRSGETILKAASRFMESGTPLSGVRREGPLLQIRTSYDPFQDADYIAEEVRHYMEEGIPLSEIAIFYRMRNQAEIYARILKESGIPAKICARSSFYENQTLSFLFHLIKACLEPSDYQAVLFVLTDKSFGAGLKDAKALYLYEEGIRTRSTKQTADALFLLSQIRSFKESFLSTDLSFTDFFFKHLALAERLHPTASDYEKNMELVRRYLSAMSVFINNQADKREQLSQAAGFLSTTALSDAGLAEFLEDAAETEAVSLMTLHAAKGLEFSHVFIVGVNNGLIPLAGSANDEDEERRLFFVGMTRAKDMLTLSCYQNPPTAGIRPGPGSFLKLIPKKYVDDGTKKGPAVDFKTLKYMVLDEKKEESLPQIRYASHQRYGRGIIKKEDDMMITVEFEGFGEKEFIKAFSELTIE